MKKTLIKQLLDRRVPQILGSYFVGATTLLFFIDWLIEKYGFSDYYTSFALFGLISILPSVIILAYFHGTPGKDEWTKVEKFGIPVNILFIAIALFAGYKFNLWQEEAPDHSKVYDSFVIHISSSSKSSEQFNVAGIINEYRSLVDTIYPVSDKRLNKIRDYVNVNIKKELMHYNLDINFAENLKEKNMLDQIFPASYHGYLYDIYENTDNEEIKKQRKEILKINQDLIYDVNDYFNKKYNTHVDWIIKINLIEGKLSTAGKRISKLNILSSPINSDIAYGYEVTATKVNQSDEGRSFTWVYSKGSGLQEEVEGELEKMLFDNLLSKIQDFSFGSSIGTVASILDSNLVTIKLKNLDIIKGTELICLSRTYDYSKKTDSSIEDNRKKFIDDSQIIYNYLFEHQDEVEKLYNVLNLSNFDETTSDYLKSTKDMIDSLKYNYQKFIDEFPEDRNTQQSNSEFRYFLKVLNVQDSIATAKITGSVFPFAYPQVGDEINIK